MTTDPKIASELSAVLGPVILGWQDTHDGVATMWVSPAAVHDVLARLKRELPRPFAMLYDLTAIDERRRAHRHGQPASDFTVVYHLLSPQRNADVRVKVALRGELPRLASVTDLWPCADWYEREVWDMFGVGFDGHPNLRRLLMPPWWQGHPLRKEHPSRATEMGPLNMTPERRESMEHQLEFRPGDWGLSDDCDARCMFLNIGPHHPGTHGVLRLVLQMEGDVIRQCVPDIGFHHRAAEKMGERQTWHTYIPYTDRVDYLAGVQNNFPYVLAVEAMAGVDVPDRAKVIRILTAELFRIASHLVFYGTFAADLGMMSPVFYMFNDRERVMDLVEAFSGARMHPSYFRIGGVAADLPEGFLDEVRAFIPHMRRSLDEYETIVMDNPIFRGRCVDVGDYSLAEAIDWGVTGPGLRACGLDWDLRKKRPYGGYDQFDFDVPTCTGGDAYDRCRVHVEEMRQSLRIIEQCANHMPGGDYKSRHPLATPPAKHRTMHDIETLITHFLGVSWGPVIPPAEAMVSVEAPKGMNGYYLVSDGSTTSYRTRIRTPSFPHIQMVPLLAQGGNVHDLITILGAVDFVLSDVDR
jgi:NADH-quinone oxidoreductase subunit C/D